MQEIKQVSIQKDYLISLYSTDSDYTDCFRLTTDTLSSEPPPKDCMVTFFKSFPPIFIKLLLFRETIARFLGLKTASAANAQEREKELEEFQGNIGDSIAIFEVLDKNETELVTGQTDKHLDFKLSFISRTENDLQIIELATTVKINNLLGKGYFFLVKPIHVYFMTRILKRMFKKLK
jgi:hypothetical protein